MQKLIFLPSLVAFTSLSLLLFFGLLVEQREFIGEMNHTIDNKDIFLLSSDGRSTVDLFFPYDEESTLVIDDFGEVLVTGLYFKYFNILKVDEITESTPSLAFCYLD